MDHYDIQARGGSYVLAWAPAMYGLTVTACIAIAGWNGITAVAAVGVGTALTSGMLWLGMNRGSHAGKEAEEALAKEWGGMPTHRWLEHGNSELTPEQKREIHRALRRKGVETPSPEDEIQDPSRAKEQWSKAVAQLRHHAKDDSRLGGYNRQYGMHRNLYGLRKTNLAVGIVTTTVLGLWATAAVLCPQAGPYSAPVAGTAVAAAFTIVGQTLATRENVRKSAERYARQLFRCIEGW